MDDSVKQYIEESEPLSAEEAREMGDQYHREHHSLAGADLHRAANRIEELEADVKGWRSENDHLDRELKAVRHKHANASLDLRDMQERAERAESALANLRRLHGYDDRDISCECGWLHKDVSADEYTCGNCERVHTREGGDTNGE